jgi:hypothetical protein
MSIQTRSSAVVVALFLVGPLALQPAGLAAEAAAGGAHAELVAALTRQSDQWDKDIVRKDAVAIAANMAEDFRHIGSDGAVADKAAFVRTPRSSPVTPA